MLPNFFIMEIGIGIAIPIILMQLFDLAFQKDINEIEKTKVHDKRDVHENIYPSRITNKTCEICNARF